MPGRRRKNSASYKKPALRFTESPVSVLRNCPSPVYANDHPPTADVVPIDEDASALWVSPQFQGVTASARRTRQRKRLNSTSVVTRSRNKSGHNVSAPSGRTCNIAFPALKFIGEKSPEPPSPIQEISIIDSQGPEDRLNAESAAQEENNTSIQSGDNDIAMPILRTRRKRTKAKEKSRPSKLHAINFNLSSEEDSPSREKRSSNFQKNEKLSETSGDNITISNMTDLSRRKEPPVNGTVNLELSSNGASSILSTQVRPRVGHKERPKRKLFKPDQSYLSVNQTGACGESANGKPCVGSSDENSSHQGEPHAGQCPDSSNNCQDAISQGFTPLSSEKLGSSFKLTPGGLRRCSLRVNIKDLFFSTPDSKSDNGEQRILVSDTPVDEYGLSIKARGLKRLRERLKALKNRKS